MFKYTEHIYQRYLPLFFQTRGIKELEVFAPQCEVLNKTKILMLDEVFDEYIRKYLEGKQDEK